MLDLSSAVPFSRIMYDFVKKTVMEGCQNLHHKWKAQSYENMYIARTWRWQQSLTFIGLCRVSSLKRQFLWRESIHLYKLYNYIRFVVLFLLLCVRHCVANAGIGNTTKNLSDRKCQFFLVKAQLTILYQRIFVMHDITTNLCLLILDT